MKASFAYESLMLLLLILLCNQTPFLISTTQAFRGQKMNVTFKLLAVESNFNGTPLKSAQRLIENLMLFVNWQNYTHMNLLCSAYIHLLSNVNYEEIDSECKPCYRGNATKSNVIDEIRSFLNESEDDCPSISVFYYVGESKREISDGKTSFFMDLDKPLFDWEIDDILPFNQSKKSTLIILDTQYGGGYISKLQKPGRVILCACNPVEKIFVGLFTGHENARYANGTCFGPLGIIGAMHAAEDINKDGWLSADEVFRFSWKTL
ncbi:MAG: hypothetical protein QW279_13055, partial [Candidatus Jordarchaeaceae archaeon]